MKATHKIVHNGKCYEVGDELPAEVAEQLKPSIEKTKEIAKELEKDKPIVSVEKVEKPEKADETEKANDK